MLGLSRLEIYLIAGALLLVVAAGAGGWCYHLGVVHERHDWEVKQAEATAEDLQSLRESIDQNTAIAKGTLGAISGIKVTHITTRGVLEREIQTNTIYSRDCLPESGRLQWNAISAGRALVPAEPAGQQPDKRGADVPGGNGTASAGRQGRNSAAKP